MKIKIIQLISLTALFAIWSGCSQEMGSNTPGRSELVARNIVGGVDSTAAFQKENGIVGLLIQSIDGEEGLCTGTLIAKRIVLTAAHCLMSSSRIQSIAVIFTTDAAKLTKETVRFAVRVRAHELFPSSAGRSGAWNDIALLKLNEDAPTDVKLVQLPSAPFGFSKPRQLTAKTPIIQAGFGKTVATRGPASETTDTSGVLRQVSGIEVISVIQSGKELLLKEDGKGSCNGDSGGPAFTKSFLGKLTQVGINSRGTDPTNCIGVGIFTSVAAHLDWIKTNSASLMASN